MAHRSASICWRCGALQGDVLEQLLAERERELLQPPINDEGALRLESSLIDFVEAAWPSMDPSEYQSNLAVTGLCEHLEAVGNGQIRRLLVNFPPRCSKTLVSSVAFPAWVWAQREATYLTGGPLTSQWLDSPSSLRHCGDIRSGPATDGAAGL